MGDSVASVTTPARTSDVDLPLSVDFALIGHQESWRAAADVLAVLMILVGRQVDDGRKVGGRLLGEEDRGEYGGKG